MGSWVTPRAPRKNLTLPTPALLDGAIGTEIQRRGATIDPILWSALATLTHPDTVAAVHQSYADAGCDIITANTFFSSWNNIVHAGRDEDFVALNARSIQLARASSERSAGRPLVAASISTMPPLNRASYLDTGSRTTQSFAEQIRIFESEGADLLLLEMVIETESASSLLDACAGSSLPIWVGLSASQGESEDSLIGFRRPGSYGALRDEPFSDLCRCVASFDPDAMGVMHTQPALLDDALACVAECFSGPRYTYPNVGYFRKPEWVFPDEAETTALCRQLSGMTHELGLAAVGGCCGTTPGFIRSLGEAIRSTRQ